MITKTVHWGGLAYLYYLIIWYKPFIDRFQRKKVQMGSTHFTHKTKILSWCDMVHCKQYVSCGKCLNKRRRCKQFDWLYKKTRVIFPLSDPAAIDSLISDSRKWKLLQYCLSTQEGRQEKRSTLNSEENDTPAYTCLWIAFVFSLIFYS